MKIKINSLIKTSKVFISPLSVLFLLFASPAFSVEDKSNESDSSIAQATDLQRQQLDNEISQMRQNIAAYVSAAKFEEAEKEYDKIFKLYDSLGDTRYVQIKESILRSEKNLFYKKWADYLEDQAGNAFLNREYDKSIKLSEESVDVIKKIGLKKPSTSMVAKPKELIQNSNYAKLNEGFSQ